MLIVAIVIAIIGTIPVIIRKKLLKNYAKFKKNVANRSLNLA